MLKENSDKNDTFSQTRSNLRASIMINVAIHFAEIPRVRKNLIDVGRPWDAEISEGLSFPRCSYNVCDGFMDMGFWALFVLRENGMN